jgi:hypothetical protein
MWALNPRQVMEIARVSPDENVNDLSEGELQLSRSGDMFTKNEVTNPREEAAGVDHVCRRGGEASDIWVVSARQVRAV